MGMATPIDLTTRRFERLEKAQKETNVRLEKVENALAGIANILESHSRHFERMEDAMLGVSDRIDRLTSAIARGRTQDLVRFDDHDRRIRALESAGRRKRKQRP